MARGGLLHLGSAGCHPLPLLIPVQPGLAFSRSRACMLLSQPVAANALSIAPGLAEQLDGRQGEPVDLGSDDFRCSLRREPLGVVVSWPG